MALLVQLPDNASTSKYPKTFPQPLNLSAIHKTNDIFMDLALDCFKKKKADIYKSLDQAISVINKWDKNESVYINAGNYPADATYAEFYFYFFDKMMRPFNAMGTYVEIYGEKLKKRFKMMHIFDPIYYKPKYSVINHATYPKVNGKIKAAIRASIGCPRNCTMCPVPQCFNHFKFYDVQETADHIESLYNEGVRYFTFIDDNLTVDKRFKELLLEIRSRKLPGTQFHCQEGLDMQAFDGELADLLTELKFDDLKIAFENIHPHILKKINKTHITPELIGRTCKIIKEKNLKVKAFLLLGLGETYEEAMANIIFFSTQGLTMRINIVRDYRDSFLATVDQKIPDVELRRLKALAYASSFWTESFGVNIFGDPKVALEKVGLSYEGDVVTGKKTKFGFQTSRFEKGLEHMLKRKVKDNSGLSILFHEHPTTTLAEGEVKAKLVQREPAKKEKPKFIEKFMGLVKRKKTVEEKPKPKPKLVKRNKSVAPNDPKGFSAESLKKSRNIRQEFLGRFGIDGKVPCSILKHDRNESRRNKTIDLSVAERGGNYAHHYKKNAMKIAKSENYVPGLDTSGMMTQGRTNYLSAFPQNIGRIITDLYCPDGGTVYDPFAGHNSRMQMVFQLGRNYEGCDVCAEFMADNRKIKEMLYQRREDSLKVINKDNWIKLHECSSDCVPVEDNTADFTITSPPYWNLEDYGPEEEQLGNAKTYESFLDLLGNHIKENYRVLKPGAFCAWNINDFRKNKQFYPYHIGVYQKMLEAGFIPFNIYIIDLGHTVNQMFVQDVINHRLLPKQHEYIILMRKEGKEWWKNG